MESIKSLIKPIVKSKSKATERGDLLVYFQNEVNRSRDGVKFKKLRIQAIAARLTKIETKDLYALKSKMEDGGRRNVNPGMVFWKETKSILS